MEFHDLIRNHMRKDIVYTTPDERLADVIFKMSHAGTDIAVVKSKDDLAGVITESDIYFALVKDVLPDPVNQQKKPRDITNLKVAEIMRGPPAKQVMDTCERTGIHPCVDTFEDDTIEEAIRIMQRSGLHHLLVNDKHNKLVGTLSSGDIIKSFGRSKEKKL
jgi:CBS domain-containing protein